MSLSHLARHRPGSECKDKRITIFGAPVIRRVDDDRRRQRLTLAYEQAKVSLIQAVKAGHAFVFDETRERLALSRELAEKLLAELANPR